LETTIQVPEAIDRVPVYGVGERNLKMIREALGVNLTAREGVVRVRGEGQAVDAASNVIDSLIRASERGLTMNRQQVLDAIAEAGWQAGRRAGARRTAAESNGDAAGLGRLDVFTSGRPVVAKSPNQQAYLDAILSRDLVFGLGPAGTGKTYLAVAAGIHLLKTGRVKKLVLARPAVEAGEKLGFLPGDQYAKVNPYLRPLLDALHDMMDYATIKRFMANDVVEISPLAYMRGRTLNDAAIILDEAQNTTRGQMQMFLTRMGQRSKTVVTGDTTQIDLPDPSESGLIDAARRLSRVAGVQFCALDTGDVVRHELVQRIIEAYAEEKPRRRRAAMTPADSSAPDREASDG
jgi:phosphate starvation-inducible PhoH-like protein